MKGRITIDKITPFVAQSEYKKERSAQNDIKMFLDFPDALTIEQLQAALQIGRNTAYGLIRSGAVKAIRIGRNIRIPKQYLLEFVSNQCYNKSVATNLPS